MKKKISTDRNHLKKIEKNQFPTFGPPFSGDDKLSGAVAADNQPEETEIEKGALARIKSDKSVFVGIFIVMVMIAAMLLFTACSKNIDFQDSSVVPAAQGSVMIKTDNNNNYVIQIQISDLADAGRLQPPKQSYVAWIETDKGRVDNVGQLNSSTGFLSKQMTATLKTVSSYKPVKIFITAENEINVEHPDRLVVLSTERF